ncbi:MAG TPA: YraN family protein [Pirellulaceae bacterium]|nr:YraN family protein [Pirellulaceae bacterium]
MRRLIRRIWWLYFRPRTLGERGEFAAMRFLRRLGYRVIVHSQRGTFGELDIIAVDGKTIVFVEVKTRRTHDAGHPVDAVDARKRRRLTRLGLAYLKRHGLLECRARFDIVAITWPDDKRPPTIEHFANAFEPTGGSMFG